MGMNGKEEEEKKEEKEAFGREGRGRATTRMLEACSTSQGSLLVLFTCTALLRGLCGAGAGRRGAAGGDPVGPPHVVVDACTAY